MMITAMCKYSGLFGHQPRHGLFLPLDDGGERYKAENSRHNPHARYNTDWELRGPDARLREIRTKRTVTVPLYMGHAPMCCKHMHPMTPTYEQGEYAGYICRDCAMEEEDRREHLCSHPQQVSAEELILTDALRLERHIMTRSPLSRNAYSNDCYTRRFVDGWVSKLLPDLIAQGLI